jgi:hypothetical protein
MITKIPATTKEIVIALSSRLKKDPWILKNIIKAVISGIMIMI